MMLDLEGHHVGVWRLRVAFCESHDGSCESRVKGGDLGVGLMTREGEGDRKMEKVTLLVLLCSNHPWASLFFLHLSSVSFPIFSFT